MFVVIRKILSKILGVIIVIGIIALIIAAIVTYKPVHYQQDYSNDVSWLSKNLNGVESGEYESCYECWNILGTTQVPPGAGGDTDYHGYLSISAEEAERLNNDYNWNLTVTPLPDMGNINIPSDGTDSWYECKDFNSDKFGGMRMTDIRYNKKDTIVFSTAFTD